MIKTPANWRGADEAIVIDWTEVAGGDRVASVAGLLAREASDSYSGGSTGIPEVFSVNRDGSSSGLARKFRRH